MPRCALTGLRVGAGRDQPALHHFLQEAVLHQALAMNPAQIVGTEDTSVALLQFLEHVKGFGQFFVGRGHGKLPSKIRHYKFILVFWYKYIMLHSYKSIVSIEYKCMMLFSYKSFVLHRCKCIMPFKM